MQHVIVAGPRWRNAVILDRVGRFRHRLSPRSMPVSSLENAFRSSAPPRHFIQQSGFHRIENTWECCQKLPDVLTDRSPWGRGQGDVAPREVPWLGVAIDRATLV